MALGPKAMGEAIIANLKTKSGRDLAEWQRELTRAGVADEAAALQHLRDVGLGQFQAATIIERTYRGDQYEEPSALVDALFARYPDQRALFDHAVAALDPEVFRLQPCRTYLPLYRDGRIAVSFKPTPRGLYAALILADPEAWPDRHAHKPSLGGSPRLTDGVYLAGSDDVTRLAESLG